jgi:hypothetical protein
MTQDQLRMQMLAGIITENQYKAKLNEGLSQEDIMQSLKDLIEAGELTGAQVRVMMDELKAYHRAWVNRQRSPENRSESAKYGTYMKSVNDKMKAWRMKNGYYPSIVDPQIHDLDTFKSFDTTKLGPKGAEVVKKAIYYFENPKEWEQIFKKNQERISKLNLESLNEDERSEKEKEFQERYQNNLLPLKTDNGSGTPDPKYYEVANTYTFTDRDGNEYISHKDPKSGYTDYKLKDEWTDTPVENSVLNKFWKDSTMRYFGIKRK